VNGLWEGISSVAPVDPGGHPPSWVVTGEPVSTAIALVPRGAGCTSSAAARVHSITSPSPPMPCGWRRSKEWMRLAAECADVAAVLDERDLGVGGVEAVIPDRVNGAVELGRSVCMHVAPASVNHRLRESDPGAVSSLSPSRRLTTG
jgi:hypothetical protein